MKPRTARAITFRTEPGQYDRLLKLAAKKGVNLSDVIRQAIESYLNAKHLPK
jgi:predicted DNA-binding protein